MAKFDTSSIEGYSEMTAEEKLATLESLDIPEPDYSDYVKKDVYDKTSSELAKQKKLLKDRMSDEEQAKVKEAEEREKLVQEQEQLQKDYDKLLHKVQLSESQTELLKLGFSEKLAVSTAEALIDGNLETVYENIRKHMDTFEKSVRAKVLLETPKPEYKSGDEEQIITLKELRAMSADERLKYSQEHPDEYRRLYENS